MAQLLPIAGGIAGSALGLGPIGSIGGSLLGKFLFPGQGGSQIQKGPRLGDLSVVSSAYGTIIPQGDGVVRMAGNLIWSDGIREHQHTRTISASGTAGGKGGFIGGGGTITRTYTYTVNMLWSFGVGPARDVLRIWADSKLIFDKTGAKKTKKKKNLKFTFYPGDETQEAVPDIVAYEQETPGSDQPDQHRLGSYPPHRGQVLIYFDRMQLADYGNRIPNITAEIAYNSTGAKPLNTIDYFTTTEGGTASAVQGDKLGIDWKGGYGYLVQLATSQVLIRRFLLDNMAEDQQHVISGSFVGHNGPVTVMADGSLFMIQGSSNSNVLQRIDTTAWVVTGTFGSESILTAPTATNAGSTQGAVSTTAIGPDGDVCFCLTRTIFNDILLLRWTDGPDYLWGKDINVSYTWRRICQGGSYEGYCEFYAYDSLSTYFYKITVQWDAAYDAGAGATSGVKLERFARNQNAGDCNVIVYNVIDDSIIAFFDMGDGTYTATKYPQRKSGVSGWTLSGLTFSAGGDAPAVSSQSNLTSNEYWWVNGAYVYGIDLARGKLLNDGNRIDWSGTGLGVPNAASVYDGDSGSMIVSNSSGTWRIYVGRAVGNDGTLSDIVTRLCERVGLEPADYDVTELTDSVKGFVLSRETTVRTALEPLMRAFFFDACETDWKIVFRKRANRTKVLDIPQSQLAEIDQTTGEVLKHTRDMELQLPERVTVTYLNKANDYQQGAASFKRVRSPLPAMFSQNQMKLELPIVLNHNDGKHIAEALLYSAYVERDSFAFKTGWRYAALDPTDLVDVVMDNGDRFPVRIQKNDVGADLVIDFEGLASDIAQLNVHTPGDGGFSPSQTIPTAGPSVPVIPNLPLLRDIDNPAPGQTIAYYAMHGYGPPGWRGGRLYKSADNLLYEALLDLPHEVPFGSAVTALGNTELWWRIDVTNSVRIRMVRGDDQIASITRDQLLAGNNKAILQSGSGWEIIQWQTATLEADGTLTLTNLLRGRRGTELFINGHAIGDTFLLLSTDYWDRRIYSNTEVGVSSFFKPVTYGTYLADTPATAKVHTGTDLKPYSVVNQKATTSGADIVISWRRRTRYNGALHDFDAVVPLNETSEDYDILIYSDLAGTTLLRTLTATVHNVTYTNAQFTADYGGTPTVIYVAIYQKSSVVGRGYGRIVALTVA